MLVVWLIVSLSNFLQQRCAPRNAPVFKYKLINTSSSAMSERPCDARVGSVRRVRVRVRVEFLSHPLGGLTGNEDASCVRRWKKRGRLPVGDN